MMNFPSRFLRNRINSRINFLIFSLTEPAFELFDRMLELDPSKRISANDALQSNWLKDIDEDSIKPIE